ncbi:hypothetical protein ACFWGD_07430 [Corynebacterium sp. NPDC060344]|uniref:hypothetical protein n=1 Tax=Corynebacterium sp. NPDC060344 TaxID=3347101 RepID=UPI0036557ED7
MPDTSQEVTAMFDDVHENPERRGNSPSLTAELSDGQRHALFVAQLQVLPDDWARTKGSWREFGRVLRDEFSAPAVAA